MVMNVAENIENIPTHTREKIKEAIGKTHAKFMPDSDSLEFLFELFRINVEPTFTGTCGKCKKRVVNYWRLRVENWEKKS